MKAHWRTLWEKLHTSFWFVPGVVIAAAVALSAMTLALDRSFDEAYVNSLPLVFHDGVEGARSLLSAVAASMITVTGVTFSVTIVAFTLASSQFTPRLLRNFMRDLGNQMVLGIFIATFAYCLCILRVVGGPTGDFIPRISVTCGFAMTAISIGALVYFIHHASSLIQAQSIIASIGVELDRALRPLYPEETGSDPVNNAANELPPDFDRRATEICGRESNYIEAISTDGLMSLAERHDLVIAIDRRPGDFLGEGEVLARGFPAESMTEEVRANIARAFVFGPQRTQTQDPEFMLNELVEIAVRALSPGINDPATAVLCIDRLSASLMSVAARPIPSSHRCGKNGQLRLVAKHYGFAGLVDAAFDQIRQYGRNSVPVTMRLLEALHRVATRAGREADRETVSRHAKMIERGSRDAEFDPNDLAEIAERYRAVVTAFDRGAGINAFAGLEPVRLSKAS